MAHNANFDMICTALTISFYVSKTINNVYMAYANNAQNEDDEAAADDDISHWCATKFCFYVIFWGVKIKSVWIDVAVHA